MHLTLVRHGESEANIAGLWQGHGDSPLSDTGRDQARRLAERLAGESYDVIISSDLQRAAHTAEAVAARTGGSVRRDPAWRELDLGRWEGLTRAQVHARWPEEIEALRRGEDVAVGGEESWGALALRVSAALARLRDEHAGRRVLLAVHGGVVMSLLSTLFGVGHARPRPLGRIANTSVSELLFSGEVTPPVVSRLNDASHLGAPERWVRDAHEGRRLLLRPSSEDLHGRMSELFSRREGGARLARDVPGPALLIEGDAAPTLISWNLSAG